MGRRPTTSTPAAKLIDRQASARSVLSWQLMTERRDSRCYSWRLAAEAIELGTCHSANCARSGPRQSNFPRPPSPVLETPTGTRRPAW
jgi:hypothetical protein